MKSVPKIGLRIIKSAVAVFLCYICNYFRGEDGIVFYSQLSALWCIQSYISTTKKNAVQRTIGTVIGAYAGLLVLLLYGFLREQFHLGGLLLYGTQAVITSVSIMFVLYTTVLLKKKQASYFSCVVFLSIVVIHSGDANPYFFAFNRFFDTMIGIVIGVSVNLFHLPRKQRRDILFISSLDDTLLDSSNHLNDYCRVELNRMIDEGLHFTLSTMRTPASIMEPMADIRLKIPVIAMNGAVLYDIQAKRYLDTVSLEAADANFCKQLFESNRILYFANVVIDDTLLIYYNQCQGIDLSDTHKTLINDLRTSPHRNYINRLVPDDEKVVYFMLLYPEETARQVYQQLEDTGITERCKVLQYPSDDYPGQFYIKIFSRFASKENMTELLKRRLHVQNTVTFGTIPGMYDYTVQEGDTNQVVHKIKKLFEG